MKRRGKASLLAVAAIVTAAAAGVSPAGSAAAPVGSARSSGGPGRWVQLSSGTGVENIDDPSVHRFGTTLQVVWPQGNAGGSGSLHTRILAAGGAPTSKNETLLHWNTVNEYPAILSDGHKRLIAFSGLQNNDETNPYSQGDGYYLTSSNGTAWTRAKGTFGSDPAPYNSSGTDATDAAGTPVIAYTNGFTIHYRAGFDSLPPKTTDRTIPAPSGSCCSYYSGVGYDGAVPATGGQTFGQTWTAWYSNNGKAGTEGIDAQELYPSLGSQEHAPSSSTEYSGRPSSVDPQQTVQVASRNGGAGGLYIAYGVGYPSQTGIALWKLGSRAPSILKTHDVIAFPGVAAASEGKLWVYWYDRQTGQLHANLTDQSGNSFGTTCTARPPHGTTDVWKIVGNASKNKLDLIVNASVGHGSSSEQMFSTQMLPCLGATVSPHKIRSSRGGKVTVTITHTFGVSGVITFRYNGTTKRTNDGRAVTFDIPKGTKKGNHTITFSEHGYTGGTVHFRVT